MHLSDVSDQGKRACSLKCLAKQQGGSAQNVGECPGFKVQNREDKLHVLMGEFAVRPMRWVQLGKMQCESCKVVVHTLLDVHNNPTTESLMDSIRVTNEEQHGLLNELTMPGIAVVCSDCLSLAHRIKELMQGWIGVVGGVMPAPCCCRLIIVQCPGGAAQH